MEVRSDSDAMGSGPTFRNKAAWGQYRHKLDTDHQMACAFRARQVGRRRRENRCSADAWDQFSRLATAFGPIALVTARTANRPS
jgi:hypothetical protein